MSVVSNKFPLLTPEMVCNEMGLAPVSGSYERALCNYLGIFTPTVNNSWIQTLYPALVTLRVSLDNETYSGLTISQWTLTPLEMDFNAPFNIGGMYAFGHHTCGAYNGLLPSGLYVYDDVLYFDYVFVSTHIISWLTDEFMLFCKTASGDDLQSQTIASNAVADAALASTVASQGTAISTLQSQVSAPSYNNAPGRSLNSSVQISTTKRTRVSYTVSITTALSLLNLNSSGQVFLEISSNNSTWSTINSAGITRALSVAIAVGLNETSYYNIQGEVPTGYYVRLRTTTSGGATVAFVSGQEVQY